jgi:cellulose synthase/poly-beta-1,6-N-acetylglucosamine synthase-like glycosyltransferase
MSTSPTAPSVSVVVATRNRPELLRKALGSIAAQDYPGPVELVVVYDQSEPETDLAGCTSSPTPGPPVWPAPATAA